MSISGRTSSGEKRALGHRSAISAARSALVAVDDQIAQALLGLGERTVGDGRRAVDDIVWCSKRVGQRLAAHQLSGLIELLHDGFDLGHQLPALVAQEGLARLGVAFVGGARTLLSGGRLAEVAECDHPPRRRAVRAVHRAA